MATVCICNVQYHSRRPLKCAHVTKERDFSFHLICILKAAYLVLTILDPADAEYPMEVPQQLVCHQRQWLRIYFILGSLKSVFNHKPNPLRQHC